MTKFALRDIIFLIVKYITQTNFKGGYIMENTKNQDVEFSFATIFKIFKGKFKLIIVVALLAAILGGSVGALISYTHEKDYGNTLTFYLPTSEKSNYASVIPLLESELFLEKILIDTKTEKYEGKEIRVPDLPFSKEDKQQYMQLSFEIMQAQERISELKRYFSDAPYLLTRLKEELSRKSSDYATAANVFQTYTGLQDAGLVDQIKDYKAKVEYYQTKLEEADLARREAEAAYNLEFTTYQDSEENLHEAEITLEESSEKLDDLLAKYYEEWKTDTDNEEMLNVAKKSVKFALSKEELFPDEYDKASKEEYENIPRNFLYVHVELSGNQELANKIIKNICSELGDFVVLNTTPSEDTDTIKATCLSVPNVNESEMASIPSTIIKYTVISVVLAEVVLIAAILFIYYKKTYIDEEPAAESAASDDEQKDEPKSDEEANG